MSASNIVKFKLDPNNPPGVTSRQRERLKAVAAMPDTQIDYTDLPPQSAAAQWTRPGALIPAESKGLITLRLDTDVLSFFRGTGKRYQSRINAALREYMKAHKEIVDQ